MRTVSTVESGRSAAAALGPFREWINVAPVVDQLLYLSSEPARTWSVTGFNSPIV